MRSVADDLSGFVGGEGIGKVSESPLHVSPECASALVFDPVLYHSILHHFNDDYKDLIKIEIVIGEARYEIS